MIAQRILPTVSLLLALFISPEIYAADPPLAPTRDLLGDTITTPAQWEARRKKILANTQSVMGTFPGDNRRVVLHTEVEEEVELEKHIRQLITYQSEPGSRTTAYLCIPKSATKKKLPAVLCLHPTDNTVGHKVVVGLGGREGRQYASELADRGFVTISPSYPHLADYYPNLGKLGYVSGTMKAIWDNSRAIDLLGSLGYVDMSNGVGAIGHSLGGHNAIYTAVFDQRISAVATSCGFDSYRDYKNADRKNWFFGRGWCQIRYMPRMSDYRDRLDEIPFDFPDLLAALAPRPIYINAPLHDSNFLWKSVDRCVAAAKPVYQLLGVEKVEEVVIVDHPDVDHNFPEPQREKAYRLFEKTLPGK